jgi:hypothetical protein
LHPIGKPEIEIERTNSTVEKVLSIFEETREFTIAEIRQCPVDDYPYHYFLDDYSFEEQEAYPLFYELYINNDYVFFGNIMALYGGEINRNFDYKNYSFVLLLPEDEISNYGINGKIEKTELSDLLKNRYHRAVTSVIDPESVIEMLRGKDDSEIFEYELKMLQKKKNVHNTIFWQTLKESEEPQNIMALLLLLMKLVES